MTRSEVFRKKKRRTLGGERRRGWGTNRYDPKKEKRNQTTGKGKRGMEDQPRRKNEQKGVSWLGSESGQNLMGLSRKENSGETGGRNPWKGTTKEKSRGQEEAKNECLLRVSDGGKLLRHQHLSLLGSAKAARVKRSESAKV